MDSTPMNRKTANARKGPTRPSISVILPVSVERVGWVEESVESILRQTYRDFELLIILDAPQNQEVRERIERYEQHDRRVRFILNEHNLGLPATLNRGIALARAPLVARMDGDDVALPERFECELALLRSSGADIVSSNSILIDEKGTVVGRTTHTPADAARLTRTLLTNDPHPIVHPSVLGKTAVFHKHPYDESYRNSQDFELWLRMAAAGVRFALHEKPLLKFRIPSKESRTRRVQKNIRYARFGLKAARKNFGSYWKNPCLYWYFLRLGIRLTLLQVAGLVWRESA